MIQESNPNFGATVYHYDGTGNMIQRSAATGAVTQYTYDAAGGPSLFMRVLPPSRVGLTPKSETWGTVIWCLD